MLSAVLLLALPFFTSAAPSKRATCQCGFKDSKGNVWRESIISDFTAAAGAIAAVKKDWSIQTWSRGPSGDGPFGIQNDGANVFQHNDALGMKTTAYSGSGPVHVAEIDSLRTDIQFGTFRIRAQVPSVPGAVFGFFTYFGPDGQPVQETDIEILSADTDYYQRAHYTNQPGTVNGNTDPDAAKEVVVSGADFTAFGEHRFDWLPTASNFFYNGAQTSTITKNVPKSASQILFNVWSDGGSWSRGPPKQDAIATVQYIKMYFNSTSLSAAQFNQACASAGHPAVCTV